MFMEHLHKIQWDVSFLVLFVVFCFLFFLSLVHNLVSTGGPYTKYFPLIEEAGVSLSQTLISIVLI